MSNEITCEEHLQNTVLKFETPVQPVVDCCEKTRIETLFAVVKDSCIKMDKIKKNLFYNPETQTRQITARNIELNVTAARLLHAGLGILTEAVELAEPIFDAVLNERKISTAWRANLIEEIGDLVWYQQQAIHTLCANLPHAMAVNANKLEARYGDKFSSAAATNRNLTAEQDLLINQTKNRD